MNSAIVFVLLLAVVATTLASKESISLMLFGSKGVKSCPGSRTVPTYKYSYVSREEVNGTIVCSAGARTGDDWLVASYNEGGDWGWLDCPYYDLKYPERREESKITTITYVEATVRQSSSLGYAYIVSGGPGQDHILMAIQGEDTTYIDIDAKVYGV